MNCKICNQQLDYKYYKQTLRCYNCDFQRIPLSKDDSIIS